MKDTKQPVHPVSILLFDGVCHLCHGAVQFILKRDPHGHIHFASLQSETGKQLLAQFGHQESGMQSVIFIEDSQLYTKSDAVLRVGRKLGGVWPILSRAGLVLPRFARNVLYDWVARNRYRWLGKSEQCLLPSPHTRSRFLD